MSEMKPCPFCGKEDLYFEQDEEGETNIVCDWCEYKTRIFQTIGDAARWWNTRPIEDALNKRIAGLEAENIRLGIEYQRMRLALGDIAINSKRALKESPTDHLTAHSDIERQDDKSSNNVATPIDVALRKRIAKLEEKQRWIPVSERLPEDMRDVLGLSRNAQLVVSYIEEYKMWYAPGADMLRVTHWMPLPQPPEERER